MLILRIHIRMKNYSVYIYVRFLSASILHNFHPKMCPLPLYITSDDIFNNLWVVSSSQSLISMVLCYVMFAGGVQVDYGGSELVKELLTSNEGIMLSVFNLSNCFVKF